MQYRQKSNFTLNVNISKCIFWCGMICLILPGVTSNKILQKIIIQPRIIMIMPWIAIICILLFGIKRGASLKATSFDVLLIVMAIFTMRNNFYASIGNTWNIPRYMALFITIYFLQRTEYWIDELLNLFSYIYIIYAICTIWFYFDRGFYISHIVPMFPDTASRLIQWYNEGCMAGLVEHYSINGIILGNGIVLYASRLFHPTKKKGKIWVALAVSIIAMLLTGKRGPLLFVAFALFVLYFLYHSNDKNIVKKILQVFGIGAVLAAVVLLLYQYVPELATFISRFQETAESGDVTLGRSAYWELALELFSKNRFFGAGWGRLLEYTESVIGFQANAHNIYIELLCETGIVGLAVFLAWFIGVLAVSIRFFIKSRKKEIICSPLCQYHLMYSIGIQLFFLGYGFTGNPIYDEVSYIIYFIACAIALYYHNKLVQSKRRLIYIQRYREGMLTAGASNKNVFFR